MTAKHEQSSGEHDQKDHRGSAGQERTGNVRQEDRDRQRHQRTGNPPPPSDVSQNVTTNPRDAGAGAGSTPLGEPGHDSRTWLTDDNQQKGGDRSDRAARSGATGERSTSGGRNKPQPKDQDEKGMARPRNA